MRRNPDELLTVATQEAKTQGKGNLKIFFGCAPGVGKTYSMLEDAALLRGKGLDVVIGVVETHKRADTEKLTAGFEVLVPLDVEYRHKLLKEFNIDAALARHPALIIMDEMAHTNAIGCRHEKRWQDIKELLDRGIDVYTTLNIQHVESLNEIVMQITGIAVREVVPDALIEQAHTIKLVDLSPVDLLKRMQEGKVYFAAQAELAMQSFFKKSNLIALRELALRYTAELINSEIELQRLNVTAQAPWISSERLLVYLDPHESSPKLIHVARRMASRLQAEWIVAYVEKNTLQKYLRLAEQLGAETIQLNGNNLVKELIGYAETRKVTKILLSKPKTSFWKNLFFANFARKLIEQSDRIEMYFVSQTDALKEEEAPSTPVKPKLHSHISSYLIASLYILVMTGINFLLYPILESDNLIMLYLLVVVLVASRGQRGPAVWASCLSVILYDFCFIPPRFSFAVTDVEYFLTLAVMLVIGQVISYLAVLAREKTLIARARERYTAELHGLSKKLASRRGINDLLNISTQYLSHNFSSDVMMLLSDDQKILSVYAYSGRNYISDKEKSVAQWVFDLKQIAGLGTETLPSSEAIYIPLQGIKEIIGVMRIKPQKSVTTFSGEQIRLFEACARQIALSLEVERLYRTAHN